MILLDYTLPEMDGFRTLKAIKAQCADLKIIILTMHYDESLMVLMQNGANGYLLKDEKSTVVKDAIVQVMEAGHYFPDYVSKALLKQVKHNTPTRSSAPKLSTKRFSQRKEAILALVGQFSR